MNISASILTGLMGLVMGLTGFVYMLQNPSLGSVEHGSEYQATLVTSADVGTSSIKSLSGTIGSVVVTGAGGVATNIAFYDTASTTVATTSLSSVLEIDGSAAEGTYTFDVGFGKGIMMFVPTGFAGELVVTYR